MVRFGVGILLLPLLLISNILFTVGFVVAERTLYIPSMGFIVLMVCGLRRLKMRIKTTSRTTVIVLRICVVTLLITHACRSLIRNSVWHDRQSLFTSGLQSTPNNAKAHYNYANLQSDVGNSVLALKHYRAAVQLWPNYASALNNLAALLFNETEAESLYRQVVRVQPHHANAHFSLGNLLSKQGRYDEAVDSLLTASECDRSSPQPHSSLAAIYSSLGDRDSAAKHYHIALQLAPRRPNVLLNYAMFLHRYGQLLEAAELFTRYSRLSNDSKAHVHTVDSCTLYRDVDVSDVDTLVVVGQLHELTNAPANAVRCYTAAVALLPSHVDIWLRLVKLLRSSGTPSGDWNLHQLLHLVEPNTRAYVIFQLCNYYGSVKQHQQAVTLLMQCLNGTLLPNNTDRGLLLLQLGRHLQDLGQTSLAVQNYKLAISLRPELVDAHHRLAIHLHIQGDFDKARRHYEIARRLASSHDASLINANRAKLDAAMTTTASRTINTDHHRQQQQQQRRRHNAETQPSINTSCTSSANEQCSSHRQYNSLHRHPYHMSSTHFNASNYLCIVCDSNDSRLNRR